GDHRPARNGRPCPRGLLGSAARRGDRAARGLRPAGAGISASIGRTGPRCSMAPVLSLRCATSPWRPLVRRAQAAIRGGGMSTLSHVVHLGDCLDPVSGLASLPDRSVDHAIMDPPYSEYVHRNFGRDGRINGGYWRAPLTFDAITDEMAIALANEMARTVRRWILIFGDEWVILTWQRAL